MPPKPTKLQAKENELRLMIVKDRLNKHTIETKLAMVEKEMLTEPIKQWEKMYRAREKYDITKPVPYDKHEAYEQKKYQQSNLFPSDKVLDTSL